MLFSDVANKISSLLKRADRVVMHQSAWDSALLNYQLRQSGYPGLGPKRISCTVKMAE